MASMKPTLLIFTGLTVALALPAYADFSVGQRVPAPTAAGQSVTSTPTAPFTWTPVTLPYGLNGTGQMAVGGTVDATTRLSVNPQGTGENGLTVNMPSGNNQFALSAKDTVGTILSLQRTSGFNTASLLTLANKGAYCVNYTTGQQVSLLQVWNDNIIYFGPGVDRNGSGNGEVLQFRYGRGNGFGNSIIINGVTQTLTTSLAQTISAPSATQSPVTLQAASGQTADILDLNDSTNAVRAKIDSNFKATFTGLSTTGSAVSTLAGGLSNTGYHSVTALVTPTAPTLTTATTGGTLPASTTEYYRIVAVSGTGTTLGSVEGSIATGAGTATNTITLIWAAVTGAESYKVYGRTTGAELLIVSGVTALTYTDTGSITPAGALPTTNTTGYVNSILYQANGTPGVTTTLADGSAVTGGIVTAPGTAIVGNGSQVAVGGTVDATTRLSVNPQGAAENGLTVNMPSGTTGNALTVKDSTGGLRGYLTNDGRFVLNPALYSGGYLFSPSTEDGTLLVGTRSPAVPAIIVHGGSGQTGDLMQWKSGGTILSRIKSDGSYQYGSLNSTVLFDNAGRVYINSDSDVNMIPSAIDTSLAVTSHTAGVPISVFRGISGQTADFIDFQNNGGTTSAKVDKNFVMTAKGFASSVRVVTAADTATLTDSVLLCNGTFTETLPATGWPTGYRLTVKDTGTGTITLTAGGTVTFDGATTITFATQYKSRVFVFDGVNFQIESGLL